MKEENLAVIISLLVIALSALALAGWFVYKHYQQGAALTALVMIASNVVSGLIGYLTKGMMNGKAASPAPAPPTGNQSGYIKTWAMVCLALLSILMLCIFGGCPKTMTSAVYGPDMTPEQTREAVWSDAYTIGNVRVSVACSRLEKGMKADDPNVAADTIKSAKLALCDEILNRVAVVKMSGDPMAEINQYWYEQLAKEDDEERLMIIAGAGMLGRRLLSRVNVKVVETELGQRFDAANLDLPLFLHGVEGYEKAVTDYRAMVEKK